MKRHQARLWPVERKDEKLKQRGYFTCMLTKRPQHKKNKDKKKQH